MGACGVGPRGIFLVRETYKDSLYIYIYLKNMIPYIYISVFLIKLNHFVNLTFDHFRDLVTDVCSCVREKPF